MTETKVGPAEPSAGDSELAGRLEKYRTELTGYCYRMLASPFEAEDAVQEALLRAWRGAGAFEGRASLRSWLYRIATNVCLDMLNARRRRAQPMDLGPAWSSGSPQPSSLPENTWIEPIPDDRALPSGGDPGDVAVARESIRLAFVTALQQLPPRQRAVLILRDVLRFKADEVAELLDSTTAAVNSALQRARATIAAENVSAAEPFAPLDEDQQQLLARYVDAFERYDLDLLTSLLHEEATQCMPPLNMWLRGHADIRAWWLGPGVDCRGSRLVATVANGAPAFGQWRPGGVPGTFEPWALHVLDIEDGLISAMTTFLDTAKVFPLFGLPSQPPALPGP